MLGKMRKIWTLVRKHADLQGTCHKSKIINIRSYLGKGGFA